jgi:hypothetical protein
MGRERSSVQEQNVGCSLVGVPLEVVEAHGVHDRLAIGRKHELRDVQVSELGGVPQVRELPLGVEPGARLVAHIVRHDPTLRDPGKEEGPGSPAPPLACRRAK